MINFELTSTFLWVLIATTVIYRILSALRSERDKQESEWNKLEEEYIRQNWEDFNK